MGWGDVFKQPPTNPEGVSRSLPVEPGGTQAPTTTGAQGGQNIQALVQAFLAGKPPGAATLQALKAHLAQQGINIDIPTRGGGALSDDKIVLPDQSVIDLWGDVGGRNDVQWSQDGYWVNGQPSATPGFVSQDPREMGGLPPGYSTMGRNGLASFDAPGILSPFTQQFSFSPQEMLDSPFYQFAQDEAMRSVNKSKAAQGTLNTGGTLKALAKYAGNVAGQQYGDEFNRRYGVYAGDKDTYFRNADATWGRLSGLANLGATAASSYANNVSAIQDQQGNTNAARARNQPWWLPAAQTGINIGADAIFNRG